MCNIYYIYFFLIFWVSIYNKYYTWSIFAHGYTIIMWNAQISNCVKIMKD